MNVEASCFSVGTRLRDGVVLADVSTDAPSVKAQMLQTLFVDRSVVFFLT